MTSKEKDLIKVAQEWYKGKTTITDKQYDKMLKEVLQENPSFNLFDHINLDGETVKHKYKFPELRKPQIDKFNLESSSTQKLLKSLSGKGYMITPKLSGCSVVEYYDEDGNLEDIVTKSNDYNGKRKLSSFNKMVPIKVPSGIKLVNTEAIVELDKGFGYNSESKANGLVNSKHKPDEVRSLLTFVVWDLQLYDWCNRSKAEMLEELRKLSTDCYKVVSPTPFSVDKLEWSSKFITDDYSSLIDGYVIYSSNHNLITALKFYFNESKEVVVKKIEWNLSDKLGLIPKITFDPVTIEGKNIKQCSSNGIENLMKLDISEGSRIEVARINSTIPQVVNVIDKGKGFKYPKCPSCKTQLDESCILKSVLYCSNPLCPDKINWMTNQVGNVTLDKLEGKTDKYTIDAMNLSNFDKSRKRKGKWTDQDIEDIIDCIESGNAEEFYELIKSHFDLNNDNKKKCKLLIPSLLNVLKNKLNI